MWLDSLTIRSCSCWEIWLPQPCRQSPTPFEDHCHFEYHSGQYQNLQFSFWRPKSPAIYFSELKSPKHAISRKTTIFRPLLVTCQSWYVEGSPVQFEGDFGTYDQTTLMNSSDMSIPTTKICTCARKKKCVEGCIVSCTVHDCNAPFSSPIRWNTGSLHIPSDLMWSDASISDVSKLLDMMQTTKTCGIQEMLLYDVPLGQITCKTQETKNIHMNTKVRITYLQHK